MKFIPVWTWQKDAAPEGCVEFAQAQPHSIDSILTVSILAQAVITRFFIETLAESA